MWGLSCTWDTEPGGGIRGSWAGASLSLGEGPWCTNAGKLSLPRRGSQRCPLPPLTSALTGAGSLLVSLGYLSLPFAQQTH